MIKDGTASPLDRVAAMIALGPATTDAELARLDRIAARFAGPELARALEIGPAADEATLAQLLEDIESGAIARTAPIVAQREVEARSQEREREGRPSGLVDEDEVDEVVALPQDILQDTTRVADLEVRDIEHAAVIHARRVPEANALGPPAAGVLLVLAIVSMVVAMASGADLFEAASLVIMFLGAPMGAIFLVASNRRRRRIPVTLWFDDKAFVIATPEGEQITRSRFGRIAKVGRTLKDVRFGVEVRTRDRSTETLVLSSDEEANQLVQRLQKLVRDATGRGARAKKRKRSTRKAHPERDERRTADPAEEEEVEVQSIEKRGRERKA